MLPTSKSMIFEQYGVKSKINDVIPVFLIVTIFFSNVCFSFPYLKELKGISL
nr:MAG TPA: hypothetical protein [Caudoviricetes sp.]